MSAPRRILGMFAHPDDEILGPGGTLAHYARMGAQIETVCTTRGEAGEIAHPSLATPDTLAQVREQEMLCSAQVLGIQKVHFLGYRDSGMAETADNEHPQAYINAPVAEVVAKLVAIIRTFRPHLVFTFEPYGGYGHPDHIAIHNHTLAALAAAADVTYQPALGAIWQTPRLFYGILPFYFFMQMKERMAAHGLPLDFFEGLEGRRQQGWPDDKITCIMDIGAAVDAKWDAFFCHRTQFGEDNIFLRLPEAEMKQLLRHEYFYLARPQGDEVHLQDLFDGLEEWQQG